MNIELNRLARLARRLVSSPTAVLCLLGEDSGGGKTASVGTFDRRADSFALEVATAGRAAVAADRIGVPLLSPSGRALGAICAIGARFPLYDENDMMALADLAVSAVREIELSEKDALIKALVNCAADAADEDEPYAEFDTILAVGTPFPEATRMK
jgi:hypothetical protein